MKKILLAAAMGLGVLGAAATASATPEASDFDTIFEDISNRG